MFKYIINPSFTEDSMKTDKKKSKNLKDIETIYKYCLK